MPSQARAQPASYATVITALNMRQGPSTQYAVILVLPAGAQVTVYQCQSWCQVGYSNRTGWVSERYLNFGTAASGDPEPPAPAPPQGQVYAQTTVTLNMRHGPSTQYGVILAIPAGATVAVYRCTQGYAWCEVAYSGRTGWVSARYLRYSQQPLPNVGAQLGLALFEFILGQIGGQPPTPQPPQPGRACFYADFNYQGASFCLAVGNTINALDQNWNDRISSIRLSPGVSVQVCEHYGFEGRCDRYDGDVAALQGNRNDAISSIRVR
jgi:uncharacterized protein YraI